MTLQRYATIEPWTISLDTGFETIDNGDSWQAILDDRVVYVSSMTIAARGGIPVSAETLCATVAASMDAEREQHSVSEHSLAGLAQVNREAGHSQLRGFMCIPGRIATCVVDFDKEEDTEWAVATWKSLRAS